MSYSVPARWLATLAAIAALTAVAQTLPAPPVEPATPEVSFRSAFDGYQPFADEKAVPWKEANELVHRRGGWRAYAKEAAEGSKEGAPPTGGADPHAGHSMPMQKKEQR